ncbi:hypothetical protein RF11_09036 [Thelohanellus kitauei]|uniref:Uncharacterized protein n=1 Tax=Thelohanellus kitauei TaxID=669202 RepID=A0A0C2N9X6_THEKT|nr:hypothetical protein RF11_09036 [Thelohanellus kitauei]
MSLGHTKRRFKVGQLLPDHLQVSKVKKIVEDTVHRYKGSETIFWHHIRNALLQQVKLRVWWRNFMLNNTLSCYVETHSRKLAHSSQENAPKPKTILGYKILLTRDDMFLMSIVLLGLVHAFFITSCIMRRHLMFESRLYRTNHGYMKLPERDI